MHLHFEPGLIDRDQLAIGLGPGRDAMRRGVNQSQLSQDTPWTDRFQQATLPEELYFPCLNDVHHLARLALPDDQLTGQKNFTMLLVLKEMGNSHFNASVLRLKK
jgi:hypothetical protein